MLLIAKVPEVRVAFVTSPTSGGERIRLREYDVPSDRYCIATLRKYGVGATYLKETGADCRCFCETGRGRVRGRTGRDDVKAVWERTERYADGVYPRGHRYVVRVYSRRVQVLAESEVDEG